MTHDNKSWTPKYDFTKLLSQVKSWVLPKLLPKYTIVSKLQLMRSSQNINFMPSKHSQKFQATIT